MPPDSHGRSATIIRSPVFTGGFIVSSICCEDAVSASSMNNCLREPTSTIFFDGMASPFWYTLSVMGASLFPTAIPVVRLMQVNP